MFDLDRAKKSATVFEEWMFANPACTIDISDVALSVWGYRAALAEIDRLQDREQQLKLDCDRLHNHEKTLAARIKELEAEVERLRSAVDVWEKTNFDLIAGLKAGAEEVIAKDSRIKELSDLNESLMENGNDLRARCQKAEALNKRLEAAFLEVTEAFEWEGIDGNMNRDDCRKRASEALERIKEGGKDESQ